MDPSLTTLGVSVGVVSNLVEIGLHNPCFKNTLWFLLLERREEQRRLVDEEIQILEKENQGTDGSVN